MPFDKSALAERMVADMQTAIATRSGGAFAYSKRGPAASGSSFLRR